MFRELMPLIERRPLTITVSVLTGGLVRVNVVPHGLEQDKKVNDSIPHSSKDGIAKIPDEAIKALTRPVCLTGTAEELDAGLAQSLANFSERHIELEEAFDQANQEIAAAVTAIKDREERERKERTKNRTKENAPAKASVETSPKTEGSGQGKDNEQPAKEPLPGNLDLFCG